MSANIDLVISHKGSAHITTQNVIDLIAGLSGNISGIKIFPDLYNGLAHEIIDTLQVRVKTGAALADGFFFLLTEAYDWTLDPGTVGYSRYDVLYLVLYEDSVTNVQSADLVYQVGADFLNGTSGTIPAAPTGTNIIATFALVQVLMTDGAIVNVTDYGTPYLSNSDLSQTVSDLVEQLEESVGGTVEQVNANTAALGSLRFGIDQTTGKYGYIKVGADTVTPFRDPKGDAVAGDVLSGKTFANAAEDNLTGLMTNRGAWTGTGTPSGNNQTNVPIPAGYHNGSGYVTCKGQTAYQSGHSDGFRSGRDQGRADTHQYYLSIEEYIFGGSPYYLLKLNNVEIARGLIDGNNYLFNVGFGGISKAN